MGQAARSSAGVVATLDSARRVLKQTVLTMINDRTAVVGLIGLGYVGLPLAVEAGKAGLKVIGVDVEPRKVHAIKEGWSYIPDVKSEDVAALRAAGKLEATLDYAALQFADAVSICVPTPLGKTRDRDMS